MTLTIFFLLASYLAFGQEAGEGKDSIKPGTMHVVSMGPAVVNEVKDATPLIVIDVDAQFPGGLHALKVFLSYTPYPQDLLNKSKSYKIIVAIYVDVSGKISGAEAISHNLSVTDKRAIEQYLLSMPLWEPAVQNGRSVGQSRTFSITFLPTK